jgi:TPR repeat protein
MIMIRPLRSAAAAIILASCLSATAQPMDDIASALSRGDYATALPLIRPLAEQGDPRAQFNLGVSYEHGWGVPQDFAEAAKWYRLAADQGYSLAQQNLGLLYENGRGVPQDFAQAANWYRLAAGQNNAFAQNSLGLLYENGRGVPKDTVRAHMWFNLSGAQGHEAAVRNRDALSKLMDREQVAQAQKLAREWKPTIPPKPSQPR